MKKSGGQILKEVLRGVGFAGLIILLSFIVVFGLLLFQERGQLGRAMNAHTRAHLKNMALASELYFTDCREYPKNITLLFEKPDVIGWRGPYIGGRPSVYLSDAWGNGYETIIKNDSLKICTVGADGVDGSEDDLWVELNIVGGEVEFTANFDTANWK